MLELGDYAAARSRFEASLALRRQEENARRIAWALLNVGYAAWLQGVHDLTHAHAVEALGLFQELNDKDGVLAALESLAVVALARGRKKAAARLMGAVEGQRDVLGLQGTPGWRCPRERMGEAMRAASAEPACAAGRAAGRALSLEEAIRCALEAPD